MRELNLEEQKKVLLDILIEFDRICKENGINYSLAYGTLLGAVRHHGFIPWDDDIDVIVTREDYNKIRKIANEKMDSRYRFVCAESEKGFSAPLPKIIDQKTLLKQTGHYSDKMDLGVYIDIFQLDFIPDEPAERKKIFKKSVFLQNMWSFTGNNYGRSGGLVNFVRSLANKTTMARKTAIYADKWAEKVQAGGDCMATLTFGDIVQKGRDVIEYKDMLDLADYDFEGHKFPGVRDYDKYLTLWYGDYMQLPPEDQRVSIHTTEVYWKD